MISPRWLPLRQSLAQRANAALKPPRASRPSSSSTAPPFRSNPRHRPLARRKTAPPHQPSRASLSTTPIRHTVEPSRTSILDNPPQLVRVGQKRNLPGLLFLALIPVTAFCLGTWQIYRLQRKTELLARLEDRLIRPPLLLPPRIDPEVATSDEFDYRRIVARGKFRHDREMLLGPRMRDGEQGYQVVTPLEQSWGEGIDGGPETTVLVNRGWISKKLARQEERPLGLPRETVSVEGLMRKPWQKNMFTPDNKPEKGEYYFPDVKQMAQAAGSQEVWVEATMEPELLTMLDMQAKGIPIGRTADINVRNNHAQYIVTWYGLAFATSIMFYMVVKKPPSDIARRVRMNKEWR